VGIVDVAEEGVMGGQVRVLVGAVRGESPAVVPPPLLLLLPLLLLPPPLLTPSYQLLMGAYAFAQHSEASP
jgi:hypothetical protein